MGGRGGLSYVLRSSRKDRQRPGLVVVVGAEDGKVLGEALREGHHRVVAEGGGRHHLRVGQRDRIYERGGGGVGVGYREAGVQTDAGVAPLSGSWTQSCPSQSVG
jgi:hypothetical protein